MIKLHYKKLSLSWCYNHYITLHYNHYILFVLKQNLTGNSNEWLTTSLCQRFILLLTYKNTLYKLRLPQNGWLNVIYHSVCPTTGQICLNKGRTYDICLYHIRLRPDVSAINVCCLSYIFCCGLRLLFVLFANPNIGLHCGDIRLVGFSINFCHYLQYYTCK